MKKNRLLQNIEIIFLLLLILDVILVTAAVLQMRFWEFAFSNSQSGYLNFLNQPGQSSLFLHNIVYSNFLQTLRELRFGIISGLIWGAYSLGLNIGNTILIGKKIKQAPLWITCFACLCFNFVLWDVLGGLLSGMLTFLLFALLFTLFLTIQKWKYFKSRFQVIAFFLVVTNSILMLNSFQGYMRWLG